jgi:hypothetical protein
MRGQRADHTARGPAPGPFGSTTVTCAPRDAQAQATDRPNIPAPWTTMCIATPARLDEARRTFGKSDLDRPMVIDQPHALSWRDGVPVSRRFDDPFYSLEDGLAEARHVFLGGNDLPARFRDGFHIAELGFGTGLNFAATRLAWQEAGATGRLHFTSFEAFPLAPEDLRRALAAFPEAAQFGDIIETALMVRLVGIT